MHTSNLIKPGTDNQQPGVYIEVDSDGNEVQNARHCTIEQGDRLPPTQMSGNVWKYVG